MNSDMLMPPVIITPSDTAGLTWQPEMLPME